MIESIIVTDLDARKVKMKLFPSVNLISLS